MRPNSNQSPPDPTDRVTSKTGFKMTGAMLTIGTQVDKNHFSAVAAAIVEILKQDVDQETLRTALGVFGSLTKVENVNISGCSFVNSPPAPDTTAVKVEPNNTTNGDYDATDRGDQQNGGIHDDR